jgi:ArsR family transcriptional regulator
VRIFKALSDETRLRVLKVLEVGELCVGEIALALDMEQSRISRHLRVLHDAGLVVSHRAGARMLYSLSRENVNVPARSILHLLEGWEGDHPSVLADRERLKVMIQRRE